jgi:hypothetical protein
MATGGQNHGANGAARAAAANYVTLRRAGIISRAARVLV